MAGVLAVGTNIAVLESRPQSSRGLSYPLSWSQRQDSFWPTQGVDATTGLSFSDLKSVVEGVLLSRAMDDLQEDLARRKIIPIQFSVRGHEVPQLILASLLTHQHDGISPHYRDGAAMLALGLSPTDMLAATLQRAGGMSDGRDLAVIYGLTRTSSGAVVLPQNGDVGSQFAGAAGWAQALKYRQIHLQDSSYNGAISVVSAGDGGVSANSFMPTLNIATTQNLPLLFFLQDNDYGISVPAEVQCPGGDIAKALKDYPHLFTANVEGHDIPQLVEQMQSCVRHVRQGLGPALIRVHVPRLCGHSFPDAKQHYKTEEQKVEEGERDPLLHLKKLLTRADVLTDAQWEDLETVSREKVQLALHEAQARPFPRSGTATRHLFCEVTPEVDPPVRQIGGLKGEAFARVKGLPTTSTPLREGPPINLSDAIRLTLRHELRMNPLLYIAGEDVAAKGGIFGVTRGLAKEFGSHRVSDTPLNEGIIVGCGKGGALQGFFPVLEIQFRKYAQAAWEELANVGTLRWLKANKFCAPMVVRMAGGFSKIGEPWHSMDGITDLARLTGWKIAYPSNAQSAVGLLRAAMRGRDPVIFFEHRYLYDAASARMPYPGDDYVLPFGQARLFADGQDLTIVTWGAMVERCVNAVKDSGISADVLDLQTIVPWDKEAVRASLMKTGRLLVVHEDSSTAGFGAEIVRTMSTGDSFYSFQSPPIVLGSADIPKPFAPNLMRETVPTVAGIVNSMRELMRK